MIAQNQLLGGATESLANVHVEAALPVTVAKRRGRRGDGQLVRNEVVVRHRISGEVGQVPEGERPQRLGLGVVVDLEPDVP